MDAKIPLKHLVKHRGGRLQNIATFCTACDAKSKDAVWTIDRTIMSADEAADGFAHVGVTRSILGEELVVKLMLWGRMAKQEQNVLNVFRQRPHFNIVQGVCAYECFDNPIKWQARVQAPTPFCVDNDQKFVVVIQEYIPRGDLIRHSKLWDIPTWKSIFKQLTCACIELYEKYGFLYGDWHHGNILLDETADSTHSYQAFGKTYNVETCSVRPVLTDFARSDLQPDNVEAWQLADQLGLVWDIIRCPSVPLARKLADASVTVSDCPTADEIVKMVDKTFAMIDRDTAVQK